MKFHRVLLSLGFFLNCSAAVAQANLVVNPGFESQIFGWSVRGPGATGVVYPGAPLAIYTSYGFAARTGIGFALFGSSVNPASISQTIQTSKGAKYLVEFYVAGNSGGLNYFDAKLGSTSIIRMDNITAPFSYTKVQKVVTASEDFAPLVFLSRHDPDGYWIDDISITLLGPSIFDTMLSLDATAAELRGVYAFQSEKMINGFSYDCRVFNEKNVCISVSGINHALKASSLVDASNSLAENSASVGGSYRINNNFTIGAYLEGGRTNSNGLVKLSNEMPMIAIFGAFSEESGDKSDSGLSAKLSFAYKQTGLTIARPVIYTSEPGVGSASLVTKGVELSGKYGFPVSPNTVVSPFFGVRYSENSMNGYEESIPATVSTQYSVPLSYKELKTSKTLITSGIGFKSKINEYVTLRASVGLEKAVQFRRGEFIAYSTSNPHINLVVPDSDPIKSKRLITAGLDFDFFKRQRLSLNYSHSTNAYKNESASIIFLTWTAGI